MQGLSTQLGFLPACDREDLLRVSILRGLSNGHQAHSEQISKVREHCFFCIVLVKEFKSHPRFKVRTLEPAFRWDKSWKTLKLCFITVTLYQVEEISIRYCIHFAQKQWLFTSLHSDTRILLPFSRLNFVFQGNWKLTIIFKYGHLQEEIYLIQKKII